MYYCTSIQSYNYCFLINLQLLISSLVVDLPYKYNNLLFDLTLTKMAIIEVIRLDCKKKNNILTNLNIIFSSVK